MSECPPVLIGEKVWWLGSGSGLPKKGVVRWIGKLPEICSDWAIGIELEERLPYGGVDGTWRGRQLFKCKPNHGLLVPSDRVIAKASGGLARKDAERFSRKLNSEIAAPPRIRKRDSNLLLDRHEDFKSVHLEALKIRREQDQIVEAIISQVGDEDGNLQMSPEEQVRKRDRSTYSGRKEKTNSGLFAFFRWFKRDKIQEKSLSNPGSPVLRRADSTALGSVDTLFSTATAASFSYISPNQYRPLGDASIPRRFIYQGPETSTYRNRIRRREEFDQLNRRITLREKYNLYASGSLARSLDDFCLTEFASPVSQIGTLTLSRKKNRAPDPPQVNKPSESDSLPTTLSKENLVDSRLHRRTVSESAKYKRRPSYIKGKRRAPPPPLQDSNQVEEFGTNTLRKKRKAPAPPSEVIPDPNQNGITDIINEAVLDIISEDSVNKSQEITKEESSKEINNFSTDTLRLEKGILKPTMEKHYATPKVAPTSPVSPRPWYKRNSAEGKQNENRKSKDFIQKSVEDWMLESGFPRRPFGLSTDSKFNIFSRSSEKPEEKRRSQISILTNISELDREAAEIIRRGKERESAYLASKNAKYYNECSASAPPLFSEGSTQTDPTAVDENARKASAKELISLFNSITNKISVNPKQTLEGSSEDKNHQESSSSKADVLGPPKIKEKEKVNSLEETNIDILTEKSKITVPLKLGIIERNDSFEATQTNLAGESKNDNEKESNSKSSVMNSSRHRAYQPPIIPSIPEVSESGKSETNLGRRGSDSSSSSSSSMIMKSALSNSSPLIRKLAIWICPRCTLENARWRLTCEACDMWRPTVCNYSAKKDTPNGATSLADDRTTQITRNPPTVTVSSKPLNQVVTDIIGTSQVLTLSKLKKNSQCSTPIPRTSDVVNPGPSLYPKLDQCLNLDGLDHPALIKDKKVLNVPIDDDEQSEMVRKARLAFFEKTNKPETTVKEIQTINCLGEPALVSSSEEKMKLRDMLREMKNSLPKQNKNIISDASTSGHDEKAALNKNLEASSECTIMPYKNSGKDFKNGDLNKLDKLHEVPSKITKDFPFDGKERVKEESNKPKMVCTVKEVNKPIIQTEEKEINKPIKPPEAPIRFSKIESSKPIAEPSKSFIQDSQKSIEISILTHNGLENKELNKPFTLMGTSIKSNDHFSANGSVNKEGNKIVSEHQIPIRIANSKERKNNHIPHFYPIETSFDSKPIHKTDVGGNDVPIKPMPRKSKSKVSDSKVENKIVEINREIQSKPNQTGEKKIDVTAVENNYAGPSKLDKPSTGYFVTTETTFEEIRVKPNKVSSSAQTTSQVIPSKTQSSNEAPKESKEYIVPIIVEEYSKGHGKQVLESKRVEPTKIKAQKFELMRPRDFATKLKTVPKRECMNDLSVGSPTVSKPPKSLTGDDFPRPSNKIQSEKLFMNTLALNRLLRRLETAISDGQLDLAADIAKELAQLKISCSVVRQRAEPTDIILDVYIEDKVSSKGPIPIKVKPWMRLGDLKTKIEREMEIPRCVQRWIINRVLATDIRATLQQLGLNQSHQAVYLYLVSPSPTVESPNLSDGFNSISIDVKQETSSSNIDLNRNLSSTSADGSKYNFTEVTSESTRSPINEVEINRNRGEKAQEIKIPQGKIFYSTGHLASPTSPSSPVPIVEFPTSPEPVDSSEFNQKSWKCDVCTLINNLENLACGACSTARPPHLVLIEEEEGPSTSSQNWNQEGLDEATGGGDYEKLIELDQSELVESSVDFDCPVCLVHCSASDGVVLKECLHTFCRGCLVDTVKYTEGAEVFCPYRDTDYTCNSVILEREIKALVPVDIYEDHLAKSVALAETRIANAFHCRTADCRGWCIYEDNVNLFTCPVCNHDNCLTCQAIHENMNCKQYQEKLLSDSNLSQDAKRTRDFLEEMVKNGEAMNCPTCNIVLMKKWGCDWLKCSMCKTEICWITRGPRWGPNGKGDVSAGCRCGVNGVKCHPKCTYCH